MKRYKLNRKFKLREDKKVSLIFDPKTELFYELNETAGFVLKLCDGKNSVEDIVEKAQKRFEGNKKEIESDVNELIAQFKDAKIIV